MDADSWPLCLLLVFSMLLSAFFSAAEMAYNAVNKIRIRTAAEDGDPVAKRVLYVLAHYEEALNTILIGNNIANIVTAAIATLLATRFWGAQSIAAATLGTTLLLFLFSEMTPKTLAKRDSERIARITAKPLTVLIKLLTPIAWLFNQWSGFVKSHFPPSADPSYTEDELADIIETIEDEGVLEPDTQELVQSAFEFSDKRARDILIPLSEVSSIDALATPQEIMDTINANKYSRYPVFDPRRGKPVGILQVNRFLTARLEGKYTGLKPLMLPLYSYPADMHIDDLMQDMNGRRIHMALIADEAGTMLGIVTMEDILEELVGEIWDEADVIEEAAHA